MADELADVGLPIILNSYADRSGTVNYKFKRKLKIVDLIPVRFELDFQKVGKGGEKIARQSNFIEYDYKEEIKKYQNLCRTHSLVEKQGVRLWLSDETIAQEEFANTFKNNLIEEKFNGFAGYSRGIQDAIRSVGGNSNSISDTLSEGAKANFDSAGSVIESVKSTLNKIPGMSVLGNTLAKGNHITLPKIWENSTYNPSISLNIKLVSPYGSPEAIHDNILVPLIYLLLLSSPTSNDGLTYGDIPYVRVRAYGITDMHLGIIESISIRRGGEDVVYNKFRQPLSVDISVSIKPAFEGFAAMLGDPTNPDKLVVNTEDMYNATDVVKLDKAPGPGLNSIENLVRSFQPIPESIIKPNDVETQTLTSSAGVSIISDVPVLNGFLNTVGSGAIATAEAIPTVATTIGEYAGVTKNAVSDFFNDSSNDVIAEATTASSDLTDVAFTDQYINDQLAAADTSWDLPTDLSEVTPLEFMDSWDMPTTAPTMATFDADLATELVGASPSVISAANDISESVGVELEAVNQSLLPITESFAGNMDSTFVSLKEDVGLANSDFAGSLGLNEEISSVFNTASLGNISVIESLEAPLTTIVSDVSNELVGVSGSVIGIDSVYNEIAAVTDTGLTQVGIINDSLPTALADTVTSSVSNYADSANTFNNTVTGIYTASASVSDSEFLSFENSIDAVNSNVPSAFSSALTEMTNLGLSGSSITDLIFETQNNIGNFKTNAVNYARAALNEYVGSVPQVDTISIQNLAPALSSELQPIFTASVDAINNNSQTNIGTLADAVTNEVQGMV